MEGNSRMNGQRSEFRGESRERRVEVEGGERRVKKRRGKSSGKEN
jgi:hypothetical protein